MAAAAQPESRAAARILQASNVCFCRIYHQLTVHAPNQLPHRGPAILVSNHVSGLDPLLIQSVCPRLITWMMAREYYDVRRLGWVFKQVGAIPVERSGRDLASTRAAMRSLARGAILGLFPEGRIETSRELLPLQPGVALMAIKTGVPVFPCYLDGTQRGRAMIPAVTRPCAAHIAFGPEVRFGRQNTTKMTLEAATEKIAIALADLRDKRGHFDLR